MTTFVLVPGMCHGGWSFEHLTRRLRDLGHAVHPLTLTGVSERRHLLHGTVNLDTHIQDVLAVLDGEDLRDAVLVGHSYGGMVITGAADRAPDRVDSLVYLDAVVPQDGDSCWSLVSDQERTWYADVDETGCASLPLPFFDARATPHPIASVLQPLRLTGDLGHIRRRDYVYAAGWADQSPFTHVYQRLSGDPGWTTHRLAAGHNLMRDAPDELSSILVDVAAR
ncbi:alpha/beta fold hydrolase [Actinopolymorpha sp. NPDC004070]|uniref:alpha/beta fold hydrolase n=1 Tax=Actinopolymorpha sp. NPDC004070 TaxID=3154548 RepID=UPI0033B87CFC